jgi:hypothetical protein
MKGPINIRSGWKEERTSSLNVMLYSMRIYKACKMRPIDNAPQIHDEIIIQPLPKEAITPTVTLRRTSRVATSVMLKQWEEPDELEEP